MAHRRAFYHDVKRPSRWLAALATTDELHADRCPSWQQWVGLYNEKQCSLLEKGHGNAGKELLQTQRDIQEEMFVIFVRILTGFGSTWYLIMHELCYMHVMLALNFQGQIFIYYRLIFYPSLPIYLLRTFMNAGSVCCTCLQRSLKGGSLWLSFAK